MANTIKARYDAGVTNFKQNGTAVAVIIDDLYANRDARIYENEAPTLRANSHGNQPEVVLPVLTPDRAVKRQNGRRFKDNGEEAFTLTAQDRHGVAVSIEPGVLRNVRSEYGKEIRKEYESGDLKVSRHDFLEHEIREDGISNTISTVQKDNLLAEPLEVDPSNKCKFDSGDEHPGMYVELPDGCTVYAVWYEKYQCYIAIRKLTPRECFRLQGWTDDYFEKAEFVNSDSQLYKQAGNGITVPVVEVIGEAIRDMKLEAIQ